MRTFGAFARAFRKLWADASFRALVGLAGGLLATGTIVYAVVEKWSLIDALYFCVVTLSTVGYGDLAPKTELGRGFTIIYILVGVGIIFAGAARIVEVMVADRAVQAQQSSTRPAQSEPPSRDPVDEADEESFPASDPPSFADSAISPDPTSDGRR